jgi:hypothetical protein
MPKEELIAIYDGLNAIMDELDKEMPDAYDTQAQLDELNKEYYKRAFDRYGLHRVIIGYIQSVGYRSEREGAK